MIMSITVEPNHPLAELLARKLLGIEGVPVKEQTRMIARAIREATKWAKQLRANLIKYGMHLDDCPCFIPQGKWSDNNHHTKTDEELNIKEANGLVTITVKCTCGFGPALEGKEEIQNLKSGHFCPTPQLSEFATICNCAHSDKHRAIDWASIDKLESENKELRDFIESTDNKEAFMDFQNCNK